MVQTSKVSLIKGGWLINGLDFDLFLCLFNIYFSLWSINLFSKKWSTSVNSVYKLHTELNILKLMSGFGFDEDALDFGLFIFHFIPLFFFFSLPQSISKLCYCLFLSFSLALSLSFSRKYTCNFWEKVFSNYKYQTMGTYLPGHMLIEVFKMNGIGSYLLDDLPNVYPQ